MPRPPIATMTPEEQARAVLADLVDARLIYDQAEDQVVERSYADLSLPARIEVAREFREYALSIARTLEEWA